MTKARDLANFNPTNITDTGTEGTKVASGTTAERGSTAGQIRFNSTTGLAEYYDGNAFKTIDSPPTVTSISPTNLESSNLPANITITGTNFQSGATVKFIGNDGTEISSGTVTRNSSTSLTAQVPSTVTSANEPFDIKVTNTSSSLAGTLDDVLNIDGAPIFGVASGSLGTLTGIALEASNLTNISISDDEGDSTSISVTTGSIPAGLTLASDGTFSGTATAVASDTTSTFTVTATDGTNTSTRQYSITVNALVTQTFSYTGANQTFTVPNGVTAVQAHIFGAGGGGGSTGSWNFDYRGGGGGSAVGTIDTSSLSSLLIVVGQGGEGNDTDASTPIRDSFGGGGGNNSTSDNRYTGGGGGLSGIFSSSYTQANSILIAGGGGGAGASDQSSDNKGGAGGGTTGQDGFCTANTGLRGRGATQSAGGATGSANSETQNSGSALQGGKNPSSNYGGGGGGGYFGGGAGCYDGSDLMSGGGGGSGYQDTNLISNGTLYQGSGQTPGNSSSTYRNSLGDGGAEGTDGDNGRIVLVY